MHASTENTSRTHPYICVVLSQLNSNQHHLFNLYKYNERLKSYVNTNPREFLKSREDQRLRETNTEQELSEINEFLDGILETRCIQLLGVYLKQIGKIGRIREEDVMNDDNDERNRVNRQLPSLKMFLWNMWFQQYPLGDRNKDLSGFEHCVVGEKNGQKVSGYHYWFKYYYDDSVYNESEFDSISASVRKDEQLTPDFVQVQFNKAVPNDPYHFSQGRKKSFWVGLSPECYIAILTLAQVINSSPSHRHILDEIPVHGSWYRIVVQSAVDNETGEVYLRSVYPEFRGLILISGP
ncbi:hypothetical protein C9374_002566 [Naegleria lovaniensis]|uniref:EndoU domain-containing protein n=1 Tax=Naegleria lovaniensis TaxID=51637 RepID=A0AA88GNQ5_NAELO|nr:uncharacterized protein C9374_002566 [Naegleria lovaniensis]KAG2386120.1 hypothetical protein C9374_002566 [Naegleria lovaniensis]